LQADRYRQAVEAARVAAELAEGASADVRQRAQGLLARLQEEEAAAGKDRVLLAELLEVRGPREGPKYQGDAQGLMLALAEPTADEQFAAAFRRWGLDVDGTAAAEAAARLQARPAAVVAEVVASLDEWASERRRQVRPEADWRRLADLAAALDDDPGSMRPELRAILARGRLPVERALGALSAALRPVPVPVDVPLGADRSRLRQLEGRVDPASEPVLGLLTLTRALRVAGEEALAERLLRAAVQARPREVVLHHALGQLLAAQDPPRWAEAVECYAAARVARPDLGVNLAEALLRSGRDGEGLALLARLVSERPASPYLHFELAYALKAQGRPDEAIGHYEQALRLDPKDVYAHNGLGLALRAQGKLDEAVGHYEQAIRIDPKDATAHYNLGIALYEKRKLDEAVGHYEEALRLAPKHAKAHVNLGLALEAKGRMDEAIGHYEQALRLDPKLTPAHVNLGAALKAKGQLDEAIGHFEQALRLDPKHAAVHYNLGIALSAKGRVEEAVGHYEQALRLDPKFALAHNSLGAALKAKGQLDEAIGHFEQALRIDPKDAKPHYNLGIALSAKGKRDEAIRHYEEAIRLDPKFALVHYNLGSALAAKGRLDEAVGHYQQAIRLDPHDAQAHCNLGSVLRRQGRFAESLACYKRGHELGTQQPGWRYPSAQWVRDAERLVALERKLPAILNGQARPGGAAECLDFAQFCQATKRHAAAAHFYADAFAADPKLTDVLLASHRYNAACNAALAAAGQGIDAPQPDYKERARLRGQALGWLRAALALWQKQAVSAQAEDRAAARQALRWWQKDADLTGVRDKQALAALPAAERAGWEKLWAEVADLLRRLDAAKPAAAPAGK
jgi:tetratricopeptide (TPR) repeat protein